MNDRFAKSLENWRIDAERARHRCLTRTVIFSGCMMGISGLHGILIVLAVVLTKSMVVPIVVLVAGFPIQMLAVPFALAAMVNLSLFLGGDISPRWGGWVKRVADAETEVGGNDDLPSARRASR